MSEMKDLSRQGVKMRNIGQAYDEQEPEFNLGLRVDQGPARCRTHADTTCEAEEDDAISGSTIGRGHVHPSTKMLERIGQATGTWLKISFESG